MILLFNTNISSIPDKYISCRHIYMRIVHSTCISLHYLYFFHFTETMLLPICCVLFLWQLCVTEQHKTGVTLLVRKYKYFAKKDDSAAQCDLGKHHFICKTLCMWCACCQSLNTWHPATGGTTRPAGFLTHRAALFVTVPPKTYIFMMAPCLRVSLSQGTETIFFVWK